MIWPFKRGNGTDVVGFLGKLPLAADFISYHVVTEAVAQLQKDLDEACRRRSQGSEARESYLGPVPGFCYYRFPRGHGSPILGTMMNSGDSSGRRYPFLQFRISRCLSKREWGLLPIWYGDYLQSALMMGEQAHNIASFSKLTACYQERLGWPVKMTKRGLLERKILVKQYAPLLKDRLGKIQIGQSSYHIQIPNDVHTACFVSACLQVLRGENMDMAAPDYVLWKGGSLVLSYQGLRLGKPK